MKTQTINIADIVLDFYVRVKFNEDRVLEMALAMEAGKQFPAIKVAPIPEQPGKYALIGGQHRIEAHKALGRETIEAEVITGKTRAELILFALADNDLEGPLPPTTADIVHTITLLIGEGMNRKAIVDRFEGLGMPPSVTRRHFDDARSNINKRTLQKAASLVLESGHTIPKAAEVTGIEEADLRKFMGGKTKRQVLKGLDNYKGALTNRHKGLSHRDSHLLRKLLTAYEDRETSERVVQGVLAHLLSLNANHRRMVEQYATRAEEIKNRLSNEDGMPKASRRRPTSSASSSEEEVA